MKEPLYLKRFSAHDFRCLGRVDLSFEARPGVVILVGQNGLGKTTWFEAVELALTGKVSRWEDIHQRTGLDVYAAIARAGSTTNKPAVQLYFHDQIATTSVAWPPSGLRSNSIVNLLCEDPSAWQLTHQNLRDFLRATHIFPQAASLRLLHLSPQDRWKQILQQICGFEQVTRLSENTRPEKLAELSNEVARRLEQGKERRSRMDRWARDLSELRAGEATRIEQGVNLPPQDAHAALIPLGISGEWAPQNTRSDGEQLVRHIDQQLGLCAEEQHRLSIRLQQLDGLRAVPQAWEGALAELRALEELSLRQQQAIVVAAQQVEASHAAIHEAEAQLQAHAAHRSALQDRLRDIAQIAGLQAGEQALHAELEAARAAAAQAQAARKELKEGLRKIRDQLEVRKKWEKRKKELDQRKAILQETRKQFHRLEDAEAELLDIERQITRLEQGCAEARAALPPAEAALQAAGAHHRATQQAKDRLQTELSDIEQAITQVIGHVHPETRDCPVCQARYPADGELLHRIRGAIERSSPRLAEAEDAIRAASAQVRARTEQRAQLFSELRRQEQALAQEQALRATLLQEIQTLRTRDLLSDPDHAEDALRAAEKQLATAMARLMDEDEELQSGAALEKTEEEVEASIRDVEREEDEAHRRSEGVLARLAERRAERQRLMQALHVPSMDEVEAIKEELHAAFLRADEIWSAAKKVVADAMKRHDDSLAAQPALEAALARTTASIDATGRAQAERQARWTEAGLAQHPDVGHLEAEIGRYTQEIAQQQTLQMELIALRRRLQAWLDDDTQRSRRAAMAEEAGGDDDASLDAYGAKLAADLEQARNAYLTARRARQLTEELSQIAERKKQSLYAALQASLDTPLRALLPLLLVESRFMDLAPTIEGDRRIGTTVAIKTHQEEDVDLLASEGQTSGLGFAVQLATALAFPWSRWRALLLDDPLQYSDIIHTSNLLEVLRLLVTQHHFQIFLSTHDSNLADYAMRKFKNANIYATQMIFREPGEGGGIVPTLRG